MKNDLSTYVKAEEREVKISDLLWKILRGWRLLLISAVIFAAVFGGLKYVKDKKAMVADSTQQSASAAELREQLTKEELDAVLKAEQISEWIEEKEKYQDESIVMGINAYEKGVESLQYYVDTDYKVELEKEIPKDYALELIESYVSYVENKGILTPICENLKWDKKDVYIGELISVGGRISSDGKTTTTDNGSGSTFTIYVTGESRDKIEKLSETIQKLIEDYQPVLSEQIGEHKLVRINSYYSTVVDTGLANEQTTLADTITNLQVRLDTLKSEFNSIQLQVYSGEASTVPRVQNVGMEKTTVSKKVIVLGFMAGVFFGALWIGICYILSDKIKSASELQELYGLRVLGEITEKEEKQRLLSQVDFCVDRVFRKDIQDFEKQREMLFMNLLLACSQQEISQLFITGSLAKTEEQEILWELKEYMEQSDIQVVLGESFLQNAEDLRKMSEIKNIVLLEKEEVTEYSNLERELILSSEQKTNVLGIIVMK